MRIDLNARTPEAQNSSGSEKPRPRSTREVARSAVAEDQAQLSGRQMPLRALEQLAISYPDMRQERVEALARSVRDGTYQASPEDTADALIAEMNWRSSVIR